MTSRHLMILLRLCSGVTYQGPLDPPVGGPTNPAARRYPSDLFATLLVLLTALLGLIGAPAWAADQAPDRTIIGVDTGLSNPSGVAMLARLLLSLALLFPLLAQAVIVDAPTGQVNALVKGADGTLYVGGSFTAAGANTGHGAALDAATGLVNRNFPQVLRTDNTSGLVFAAVPDAVGGWYIAGVFNSVGGLPRNNLAHIDSSGAVTAWNPSTTGGASNGGIATMVMSGSTLYIGGEFTQVNGVARSMLAAIGTDGTLLPWNPGASGTYPRALAVDNGIVYAGGGFTTVCTTAASTCWNGSAAQTRNRLAAFGAVDGSLKSWNPNATNTVNALVVSGSAVYIGGDFANLGCAAGCSFTTAPRNKLAAVGVDGSLQAWNPGANGQVWTLAISGSILYAGGDFTTVCTTAASTCWDGSAEQTRTRLAAFGTAGSLAAWNPGADATVRTLAVSGATVYLGGGLTSIGCASGCATSPAVTRNRLAAVDAATGAATAWDPNVSGNTMTYTLAVSGNTVYAGGTFAVVNQVSRNRLAAFGSNGRLTDWNPDAEGTVSALAVSSGTVYAGGQFTTVCTSAASTCWNGSAVQTRNRVAAFGGDGSLKPWDPNASGTVSALAINGSTVYLGGSFSGANSINGNLTRNRLAAVDAATGTATAWNPDVGNSAVAALAVSGSTVYAGGSFTSVCTTVDSTCWNGSAAQTRNRLAAFGGDGSLKPWDPNASGTVSALAINGSTVYAGGLFTGANSINGTLTRNRLAAVDATTGAATPWNPEAAGNVYALTFRGNTVYAGGLFTTVCTTAASTCWNGSAAQTRNRLAAFGADGTLTAWNPAANTGIVYSLLGSGDTLYAGGSFTALAGERKTVSPASYLAYLNNPTGVPTPPTSLAATPGNASAALTWTAPANNGGSAITGYDYSLDDGATWTAFSSAVTASPATITGLTNGTTYQVKLRAANANGAGESSATVAVTPVGPATPALSDNTCKDSADYYPATDTTWQAQQFLTDAQGYSLTAVTLSMLRSSGTGAARLDIYSDNSGKPGTVVGSLTPPGSYSSTLVLTAFTASGITLQAGTTYWVVLKAADAATEFGWSYTLSNDKCSGAGFSTVWGQTTDAGVNWTTDNNYPFQMKVEASAVTSTYTVTYDGNGNTGGTAPTDGNSPYTSGATVTVLGNTGSLAKTGFTFNGWNTAANGSGNSYAPAATFTINANTTLYAQWAAVLTPTTTTLTSSLNPTTVGTSVTFTATVEAAVGGTSVIRLWNGLVKAFGGSTPTGTVQFFDGATSLGTGTLDGAGQATLATSSLPVGTHSITAIYGGDSRYTSSTSLALNQVVNQAQQADLLLSADPTTIKVNTTSLMSASGGSGTGAVTYQLISGACSLSGNVLTGNSAGHCVVTATKAADASYTAVTSSPVTVTVGLVPQSPLTVQAAPTTVKTNGTSALSVTGGSGAGAVTYQVVAGPCTISGSVLTGLSAGSCAVTATKAADSVYAAATSDPATVTVELAPQTALTVLADPTTVKVNGASTLGTSGGSGTGAVTYQVISGPCTVSGATLTGLGQGSCSVTVTKAADGVYAEATSDPATITVDLAPQSPLTLLANPTTLEVNGISALDTTGGNGTGAVTYQLVSGPCSVSGSTLTGLGAGSCVVTATKAADAVYALVVSDPVTLTVSLAPQSPLTVQANPTTVDVNATSALSATGGNGTGAVTYQLISGPCSVSGSTLTGLGAGSCVVTATKAEDAVYAAITSKRATVTVELVPQSPLTLLANPTTVEVSGASALSATGGNGTGAVTYQLLSGPCSLSGSTLTGLGQGSCQVTATKAADNTYAETTSNPATITVDLAPQSPLTLLANPTTLDVDGASALSVTGGSGTGALTYQLLSGPCSLSGSTLTGLGQGTCQVAARKAADGVYAEATSAALDIPVELIPPAALTLVATPAHIGINQSSALSAIGGSGTGAVSYQLLSGPCVISGSTLTGLEAGSCTLTATQASDGVFAQGTSDPTTVTVQLLAQSALVAQANPSVIAVNGVSALSATGGDGTGLVTYQLVSGPCSLSGATLTGLEAGSCAITASKAADATYAETISEPTSVTVGLNPQAPLLITATPEAIAVNGASTLGVSGGSGTGAVSYQLVSGPCSLSGITLTGLGSGSCVITATKAADNAYAATTSVPVSVTVGMATTATTTTLTSTPNPSMAGQAVTLTATVSSVSGTPSGTVAFQDGGTVLSGCGNVGLTAGVATCPTATLAVGSHPLTAQYSGDATFAASQGTATQTVSAADLPTLTTPGLPNGVVNLPYEVTLGASGGEPPYAYSGTGLPTGLVLSPDGVLSGIPSTPGAATVVITVTDRLAQTGQRSYALRVEATVAVATPSLINGLTGAVYGQTLQAIGGALPYTWSLISGTLPAGLNLNPTTGILSGTPTVAEAQTFTVQVTDGLGQTAQQALSLTIQTASFTRPDPVDPSQAPISVGLTINPEAGPDCTFNDANSFTFNLGEHGVPVNGPPGVQLPNGLIQVVMEGCTPGLTTLTLTLVYPQPLPPGTQVWKYGKTLANPVNHWYVMPGAIIQGNTVTYSVRDGGLGDDDLLANGTIIDPAGPGVPALNLSGALPTTGQVGTAYTGTLTATAGSAGPYVWSVAAGALPPGVTLATTALATTTVSGTPTQAGTSAFTVQVLDQGNGNTAAQQAFTVNIASTQVTPTVTLSAQPSAPAVNQATTLTATVTAPTGTSDTPTGSVAISGGGQSCTATLSHGTGSCALSWASVGEVTLNGVYGGDDAFTTASGALTLSVGKTATTTALSSTPNPSTLGQAVTLTATVSSASGTPSGIVTFREGNTVLGTRTLTQGSAGLTVSTLTAGAHALTADYSGNPTFAASTGEVTQTVTVDIPTLSEWAMLLLTLLLSGLAWRQLAQPTACRRR